MDDLHNKFPFLAISLFFAILFIQSGIDKVTDRAGNLAWMEPHFDKSPLKGMVPMLLGVLTVFELTSGAICLVAAVNLFVTIHPHLGIWAMEIVCLTFLMLFSGQRLAKDYAGAASLAPYFLVALVGLFLSDLARY